MQHFRTKFGDVVAYDDDVIVNAKTGVITTSAGVEIDTGLGKLTPTSGPVEDVAADVRAERDRRLLACEWEVQRHVEQMAIIGCATSLDMTQYAALLKYRQALRDMSAQPGFPATVDWPVR